MIGYAFGGNKNMIVETVKMKLVDKTIPINLQVGQTINVFCEEIEGEVKMTVIRLYKDGSFDGEVIWEEA